MKTTTESAPALSPASASGELSKLLFVSANEELIATLKQVISSHEGYELIIVSSLKNLLDIITGQQPTTIFWDDEIEEHSTLDVLDIATSRFPKITMVAYCTSDPRRNQLQENGCTSGIDPSDKESLSGNILEVITV